MFRIVSNPQVITQKIIIVHFPNILFECLLCAGSHEGLCQLPPFFLSPTLGCDSLARNEWIRFPHLACKETETQGFTVFFLKSPVLSASGCRQLHTCNVAGTLVGTERTRWSHCLPRAHVLTEKADLKSSLEGGECCERLFSVPRPPGFYAAQCFHGLSGCFWSLRLIVGMAVVPSQGEALERRGFSSWVAGGAILGVFMNFCGIQ